MRTHRVKPPTARRHVVAAASVVLILAAGCGSDDGQGADSGAAGTTAGPADTSGAATTATTASAGGEEPADASGDACDIMSDEVASAVLGVDIVRREPTDAPGGQTCIKGLERTGDPSQFFYVSVGVIANGSALVDSFSTQEGAESVPGLGDEAVYVPSVGALVVAAGADGIQVQVVKAGVPGTQDDAVTVARDVLDRLS